MTDALVEKVLFDPGYAQHTTILSISTDILYSQIAGFKNFNQRKNKFKMTYPKLLKMVDNNTGFCLGCMLWAVYIKSLGNLPIEGNPCYGDTYNRDEAVEEIDFSINFYEKLNKDAKYYLNTEYKVDETDIKILELYKEFLEKNSAFVSTKTTDDVILPNGFNTENKENLQTIYNKIKEVIDNGNLLELKEVLNLVYKG